MKEQLETKLKEYNEIVEKYSAELNYMIGKKDQVIEILNLMKPKVEEEPPLIKVENDN